MVQIIEGKLRNPQMAVAHSDHVPQMPIELGAWKYRARWSWLRLQYGRRIDVEIKAMMEQAKVDKGGRLTRTERMLLLKEFFDEHARPEKSREIQFILGENNKVLAVASLKHLLIPPEEVYTLAAKIMKKEHQEMPRLSVDELLGINYSTGKAGSFEDLTILGIQVHGGTITTRQAITVSAMFRVRSCLNPLSFLGIGNFTKFLTNSGRAYERVLRIKVKAELEPRLRQGIESVLSAQKRLEERIEQSKTEPISPTTGKIIISAMCWSYHIGAKVIKQVVERFLFEKQTKWGLTMATSYVAAHGEFKTGTWNVGQRLSTVSGATMLIDDVKDAEKKSLAWLKEHIKKGEVKSVDELLEDIKELN